MRYWIVVMALFAMGCGKSDVPAPATGFNPVPLTLGAVYGTTGSQASLGGPSLRGAQLAADGSAGAIRLVTADAGPDPRQAVTTVLAANVDAVFGLTDSDQVAQAAPVATAAGRLFLTSGATSPLLPSQVPGVFLGCFGDNVQGAAGAEYAVGNLSVRSVSIVYQNNSTYSRLLETYFQTRFQQLGGTVVSKASYASSAEVPAAMAALTGQPDMVYFAAQPDDVAAGVAALRARGFTGPIMGGDGYDMPNLGSLDRVYFTTHADLTSREPIVANFVSAYRARYGVDPDGFAALGYDAVNLLQQVRATVGSNSAGFLRDGFLSSARTFRGVTGEFVYTTAVPVKTVTMVAVQSGQRQVVARFLPSQVPPPETPFLP